MNGKVIIKYEEIAIKKEKKQDDIKIVVTNILHELGVPANLKGFNYLREGIIMVIDDMNTIHEITKSLYPQIACKFKTTPSRVERAMRNTIDIALQRGNEDMIQNIFGLVLDKRRKPTNSQFIAMISDKLRLQLNIC